MGFRRSIGILPGIAFTVMLSGCGGESDQDRSARDKLADSDQSPVASCGWDAMDALRLNQLSHTDEIDICNTVQGTLGKRPSVALLRKLGKLVIIMQTAGSSDTAKELAYQTMNVIEARGQTQNDIAIAGSMEVIAKIFNGTQGHVTPKDLNIFLRGSGPLARTLNDDGMYSSAALIWEAKKANGE